MLFKSIFLEELEEHDADAQYILPNGVLYSTTILIEGFELIKVKV